jgi:UDP-glucose 4-epimerase
MRVLVTGGAGYIGSVVGAELLAAGHEVVVYDNLGKGHREAVPEGARFVQGELADGRALSGALEGVGAVVHMAADALVGESVTDPAKYFRNNLVNGLALLDALVARRIRSLVFSSTCAVYGEPAKLPIDESFPTQPTNPYGESKLAFERALRWYDAPHGLRSICLRYFNAAGATERSGERHDPETHLIPLVLQAAAGTRREVTIFGDDWPTPDGTCVRDYIHVKDLARAHVLAVEALAGGAQSRVYNLGCGAPGYSVRQVIDVAQRVTGRPVPVKVGPRRPGDPAVLIASAGRIVRELGWKPALQDLGAIVESAWGFMRRRE